MQESLQYVIFSGFTNCGSVWFCVVFGLFTLRALTVVLCKRGAFDSLVFFLLFTAYSFIYSDSCTLCSLKTEHIHHRRPEKNKLILRSSVLGSREV